MDNYEFKQFIDDMSQKAVELSETKQAKMELMDFLNRMEFKKVDNYRRVKGYPSINKMSKEQLEDYLASIEEFSPGDTFLTQKELEYVDRSDDLTGIKTEREARDALRKEYKAMTGEDLSSEDLKAISITDKFYYMGDAALSEQGPFFKVAVNKVQSHMISGEARYLKIEKKIQELAKAANKSRSRGGVGTVKQKFIPQHENMMNYLEAAPEEKSAFAEVLTEAELEYANYIERYYGSFYDHLVKQNELGTSRFTDQYFTHTRKKFLESLNDDGLIKAFKNIVNQQKDDRMVSNIISGDTGNILSKSKFFANTMFRSGAVDPSKNVTKVFSNYARMAERKKMLDEMIIDIDIYTQSLTPKDLTKEGLEMDRTLKKLVNTHLNNKKGRRAKFLGVSQNSTGDIGIRMVNSFVSMLDLGANIGSQTVSAIGEQIATFQSLGVIKYTKAGKRRLWDAGIKRKLTKNGSDILEDNKDFIGRNIWSELADIDMGVGPKFMKTLYGGFAQSSTEANKIFILGNATKAEMKAGKLSSERLAELRLDAARWRDMGDEIKSIYGSTSVGKALTKYVGWAIPIFRTSVKNASVTLGNIKKGIAKSYPDKKVKDALTAREAKETYTFVRNAALLFFAGEWLISEEQDDTFAGQLAWKLRREINTLLQGTNPNTFLSTGPRSFTFVSDLAENLGALMTLQEYKTNTRWGDEGDLKGLQGLKRQFTPAGVSQFGSRYEDSSSETNLGPSSDSGDLGEGLDLGDLGEGLDSGDLGEGLGSGDLGSGDLGEGL
jgi:hypothetical protein